MIPKECKRLAEVDFPIAVVSKHAAREKSIRHGHPSTLHLWWARRPLAACRAMLLGLLLPDPCDEHCPEDFKKKARELLPKVQGQVGPKDNDLQQALLKFIGDFANWDLSSDRTYLEVSRGLVKAAHPEEAPLVVDPFAGGGSIPLEALRLGCEAFASDLNPVAGLVLKVMLEDIPRHGPELAAELRRVGREIKEAAEKELADFYPVDPDGSRPIAYLWARTVRCEEPDCGSEIPLIRTNWLAKRFHKGRKLYTKLVALEIQVEDKTKQVRTTIKDYDVPTSVLPAIHPQTITSGKAICPCCKRTLNATRVRAQLSAQSGGSDITLDENGDRISGARLLAVILRQPLSDGIKYRNPTTSDINAVKRTIQKLREATSSGDIPPLPSETLSPVRPSPNARGVSGATRIGIADFGQLFTHRQKLALGILCRLAEKKSSNPEVNRILALTISKLAERCSSFVTWINSTEAPRGTFARQALTIAWDFIELVPLADEEEFFELIDAISDVITYVSGSTYLTGQVEQGNAEQPSHPDQSVGVWFTDPPYYDSVPYADLSDLFYVWLKRIIPESALNKFIRESAGGLTPKMEECVWNQAHIVDGVAKTPEFFESCVTRVFRVGRQVLTDTGIGCVVFAHKSTEGWEALLSGLLRGGWVVVASWPITTERGARLNAREAAALAASIHLVCRPRPDNAPIGDWGKVLGELPIRVGDWMERLQGEGIRGADLVFACIGPALEIFSRYSKVETAEGREVTLAEYLEKVWEVVGRTALEHVLGTAEAKARNSMAGALEEDARLTALFLWTLQSTNPSTGLGAGGEQATGNRQEAPEEGSEKDEDEDEEDKAKGKSKKGKGFSLVYDVARRFAQPLGIHLDDWEGRIIETEKGIVRLLSLAERAKQLFGEDGAEIVADELERNPEKVAQLTLFPDSRETTVPEIRVKGKTQKAKVKGKAEIRTRHEATTLDRVHAAMLLQASGRTNALRALLKAEQDRSPDFLRLANALSALYPKGSEEKRLLDAMLLAVPR